VVLVGVRGCGGMGGDWRNGKELGVPWCRSYRPTRNRRLGSQACLEGGIVSFCSDYTSVMLTGGDKRGGELLSVSTYLRRRCSSTC